MHLFLCLVSHPSSVFHCLDTVGEMSLLWCCGPPPSSSCVVGCDGVCAFGSSSPFCLVDCVGIRCLLFFFPPAVWVGIRKKNPFF